MNEINPMEHYRTYPGHSMTMGEDPNLTSVLSKLIQDEKIDAALETGTYLGLGSTKFVAECLAKVPWPKNFITIEANYENWREAVFNLRRFPFVQCLWGASVHIEEAVKFIAADDMLINHQNYHGIYIDTLDDPVGLYTKEIRGEYNFTGFQIPDITDYLCNWDGEDLLQRLQLLGHGAPLIILDSAGGIGLLEFQTVLKVMENNPFFILLDDIHHIKHYRSAALIEASPRFETLARSDSWILAGYK